MRAIHIIIGLNTGGAELMLSRLVQELTSVEHIVISLTTPGSIGSKLSERGVKVYALGMHLFNIPKAFLSLCRLIRRIQPDVVQTWMYHADLLGGMAARLCGVKRVFWNIRNTEIPQRTLSSTGILVRVCALLSYFIPMKIVCCAYAAQNRHAQLGYRRHRMTVIPNGYDIDASTPHSEKEKVRSTLGIPATAFVVGMVGRFDTLKGYDIFIHAASALSKTTKSQFVFLCAGRNVDKTNSELMEQINHTGLQNSFVLLGERSDVSSILQALDVFCLSSRAEGFPNVVAEAMLCKVPCVVTDVGDAARIVGDTGIVVSPNDSRALAEGLQALTVMDQKERQTLGLAARSRIVEQYNIAKVATRYEALYSGKDDK